MSASKETAADLATAQAHYDATLAEEPTGPEPTPLLVRARALLDKATAMHGRALAQEQAERDRQAAEARAAKEAKRDELKAQADPRTTMAEVEEIGARFALAIMPALRLIVEAEAVVARQSTAVLAHGQVCRQLGEQVGPTDLLPRVAQAAIRHAFSLCVTSAALKTKLTEPMRSLAEHCRFDVRGASPLVQGLLENAQLAKRASG